jgi:RHS repeat-associated protein
LIATYYYDPFGRRIWKEVSGVRTNFHYADEGLVGEYGAGGVEIKTYGYKPGSTWTTDPLFMKVGSEYFFYHNDHLGTPQNMISVNGAVVWSAKYSSFGKATVVVETVENNLRFAGQYYDVETALHYNWNRYYSAQNGRYNRKDPSGLASGNLNWHVYASNNPIAIYDFTGLSDYSIRDGEPNPALEWQCPKGMKRSPRKDFQYGELDGCSVPPWAVKWKGWVDKDFPRGRKKARFKTACDMHDICYRSANPAINVIGERKNCDDKFLKNLEQECQSKVGLTKADREQCLKDAKSYYWGVRFGGWDAYKVNQKRACEECKPF